MWRSLFLAVGIGLMVLGVEALIFERAEINESARLPKIFNGLFEKSTEWHIKGIQSAQLANFKENEFKKTPEFKYRLISLDPEIEKRKLYNIPIEQVDDPTIAFILRAKRLEIEKQLTMLEERGTQNFRFVLFPYPFEKEPCMVK